MGLVQTFGTRSVTNTRLALYTLSIRQPGPAAAGLPAYSYTFPLSPQAVQKSVVSLAQAYEMRGPASTRGVTRNVDEAGTAPPIFTLRGTTGFKLHSNDGYLWDGVTSIKRLEAILAQYDTLNTQQMLSGQQYLYTLEFYDYFKGDFWQVVPVGPQGFDQSADKPLLSNYTLQLAGVRAVSAFVTELEADILADTLGAGAVSAILGAQGILQDISDGYGALTSSVSSGLSSLSTLIS